MAYIIGDGITNLNLKQGNYTITGFVNCVVKEDCADITVTLEDKGIADIPDRWSRTISVKEDGSFIFKGVPKQDFVLKTEHRGYCWGR